MTSAACRPATGAVGVPAWTLVALGAATAVSPLFTDMYLATFPAMASEMAVERSAVQLTMTTFMIGFGAGQYVFGALSDRWGRRRLLLAGMALGVLSSMGAALSGGIAVLWVMRVLQGLSAATGTVLARAVVADLAVGVRRAEQMSLMMMTHSVAPVVAPVIGSALAVPIGWRGIMGVLAGFSTLVLIGLLWSLPESLAPDRRARGSVGRVLLMPVRTLGSGRLAAYAAASMMTFAVLQAYVSGSAFVLQGAFGLSPLRYGLVFAVNSLVIGVMSGLNVRLVRRIVPERLGLLGAGLMVIGAGAATADALIRPALIVFVICVTVAAAGVGICMATLMTLALNCLPADRQGSGSSVIGTGQALSAAIVSPLVGLGATPSAVPTAVVMTACGGVVLTGVLMASRRAAVT